MVRQFAISGEERRKKKKELGDLKRFVTEFWYWEDIDKVYGGGLSDSECNKIISDAKLKIKKLEDKLSVPYISIVRDSKINTLLSD
jgi:hypothetical protein